MNKGLKWALISLPILVGGFIVYRTLTKDKRVAKRKEKENDSNTNNTTTSGGNGGGGSYTAKPDFPMGVGSSGRKVKELQTAILDDGQPSIVAYLGKGGADSKFGTGTEKAVKALLGKTKVDSQADIDKIKGLKAARMGKAVVNDANANRKYYGNLIIDGLCNGKRSEEHTSELQSH